MRRFYHPEIHAGINALIETESHHISKVLRLKEGDGVELMDGEGRKAKAIIVSVSKKSVQVEVTDIQMFFEPELKIHLAVAPPKSNDRWDWLLEKAVELGVWQITPFLCYHSERRKVNVEKSQKTLVAAMKQSGNAHLPRLSNILEFKDILAFSAIEKYICYCPVEHETLLLKQFSLANEVLILVGPEGDFSEQEVEMAKETGFNTCSLGTHILRTETAAIEAFQQVKHKWQLKK